MAMVREQSYLILENQGRGTQGVKAIQVSDRNGIVVAARLVSDSDEIMLITTGGVLIRTSVSLRN